MSVMRLSLVICIGLLAVVAACAQGSLSLEDALQVELEFHIVIEGDPVRLKLDQNIDIAALACRAASV